MGRRARYGVLAAFVCLVVIGRALLAATSVPGVSIGTVHLTEGWATFGQAVPPGLAFDGLQIGSLETQTDVKNEWPDGSIKFAVLTALVPSAASYTITTGPASGAPFTPVMPDADVVLNNNGSTYVATLPDLPAADWWLSGPLVREGRHVIAPAVAGDGGSALRQHAFLRVIFDTRVYNDGDVRVDVTVENVLNQADATTTGYDVAINVNGVQSFARSNVEHFYLTRWRHMKNIGTFSAVRPDIASLHKTRAVPPYLPLVTEAFNDSTGQAFDILREGALDANMPAHGGRPELAPYPDWTARYLVHPNTQQKEFVLAHGTLAGSWPVHAREPEGGGTVPQNAPSPLRHMGVGAERFVSLEQRPDLWLDARAEFDVINDGNPRQFDYIQGIPLPIVEYGDLQPGPGQSRLIPDNAHQPSLAYVPYLLTGDRYFAEEMAMWANYGMMRTYQGNNLRGAMGLLGDQETRGMAWALRNLADAAAYYPDASPVKTYLSERVLANLQSLDALILALDPVNNPLKFFRADYRNDIIAGEGSNVGFIALWEHTYLAFAIDRAHQQGFEGGKLARDAVAELQLKLFTSDGVYPRQTELAEDLRDPVSGELILPRGFLLDWGAPYLIAIAHVNDGFTWAGGHTYFTSMQQVADATTSALHPVTGPYYLDRWRPYPGYYGPEARLNLLIGIDNYNRTGNATWARAQEAYDYLFPFIGSVTTGCEGSDLACRAGWAVAPYAAAPAPPDDVDADDDGILDAADNCPAVSNADQLNFDGDAFGDACDLDDDNDGASDFDETAAGSNPRDASSTPEICDGLDNDGDGLNDDGLPNNDRDSFADPCDPDDDNDNVSDLDEIGAGSNPLDAGSTPEICDGADNDLDGTTDEGSLDTDGDGQANCVDGDDDNDTVPDADDRFPLDINESRDNDNDGTGDNADPDDDNDTVPDAEDRFPLDINESKDNDNDGTGDNADTDDDNDTRRDDVDPFPFIANRAPTVESTGAQTSTVGVTITPLQIVAVDLDGDGLTWTTEGLPAGLSISAAGAITGTPTETGSGTVKVTVSDGLVSNATSFSWAVYNTATGGGVVVDTPLVDVTFSNVTTPGNTQVTSIPAAPGAVPGGFSVTGLPAFEVTTTAAFTGPVVLCFDVSSLALSATQWNLLRVLHGEGGVLVNRTILGPPSDFATGKVCASVTSLSPFAIASVVNQAPTVDALSAPAATVGVAVAPITIVASDADNDPLTYEANGLPPGLSLSANIISGTPTHAGTFDVVMKVSDDDGGTATTIFSWLVRPAQTESLTLANPGAQTNTEGDPVHLELDWTSRATGKRRDIRPSFSAVGLPPGLHIRQRKGEIVGRVQRRGEGSYNVTVTLQVQNEVVRQSFTWTILPRNHPPRLKAINDADSRVGRHVTLNVRALDADGDQLTFDVQGLPPGVNFNAATGQIEGVPSVSRDHYHVIVIVSDGRAVDRQSFEWRVRPLKKK